MTPLNPDSLAFYDLLAALRTADLTTAAALALDLSTVAPGELAAFQLADAIEVTHPQAAAVWQWLADQHVQLAPAAWHASRLLPALAHGQWALAQWAVDRGAPLVNPERSAQLLVDEVFEKMDLTQPDAATTAAQAVSWLMDHGAPLRLDARHDATVRVALERLGPYAGPSVGVLLALGADVITALELPQGAPAHGQRRATAGTVLHHLAHQVKDPLFGTQHRYTAEGVLALWKALLDAGVQPVQPPGRGGDALAHLAATPWADIIAQRTLANDRLAILAHQPRRASRPRYRA